MIERVCPNHGEKRPVLESIGTPFYALHGTRRVDGPDSLKQLSPEAQMQLRIWRCSECGYLQLQDNSQSV